MEMHIETAVRIHTSGYSPNDMVCVHSNPVNNTIQLANSQNYPVNYALPADCCQNTVFTTTAAPLVNYLVEGCDVSVVTLGQSGTGKSYTLLGPGFHCAASEADHGIIPRFIREVFAKMKQYRDRNWCVHIAWSQICGENVQDLLGVGSIECRNISDVFQLIQVGMSNIAPKCAHTLFTLTLEQQWVVETSVQHRVSTASFADLAGTEKVLVYDSNGMMQTIPTDLGIQTLQRCIMSLSDFNCSFVPYTQSVLTTLLKDSFGGRAKTLLICCVSPLAQDFTETLYTLQLGLRAQMIKNFVTVNSYATFESTQENCDVFGLQFAANQLLKLVSNAEELFQRLVANDLLPKSEQEQISQWLMLKQECEDCLSENSEPHRSLERIEEEIESDSSESEAIEEEEKESLLDRVQGLMETFRSNTDKLVSEANCANVTNSCTKESMNSSNNEYHMKGARGRRGSIHSAEELNPCLSLNTLRINDDVESQKIAVTSYDNKKKILKQIATALELNQKKISDLEKTIRVKENLMEKLLKHKDTKSSAHHKIEQKCQLLRKEYKNAEVKFLQAKLQKNHHLEGKYKSEVVALEERLRDTESLKNLTEDGNKLLELESSLHTDREKLKKYKQEKEKYKQIYEKQLKEERSKSKASCESVPKTPDVKVVALIKPNVSLNSEELESLRHEIRNLRKTRDYLLELRCKITLKSQNKKFLNDSDERKLLQYEEAIEAIDLIIEYKNSILCGHLPVKEIEDHGDRMLMERFLKLSENEMRILLHRYFEKIIDLRSSSKKLDLEILDIENQHENLAYRVQKLSHNLQLVRSDAERRIASLQQQHEDKLYLVLRNLTGDGADNERISRVLGSRHSAVTVQVAGASKQVDKNRFIAKWTRYRQETVPRQLQSVPPQAKVTIEKNKIILQKTNKN
ncbi:kinesin-like protein costa isoform X2 [Tribolium castaneum]|uniref:Kinesin-like protein costa n=2 Tax=Tribolium castaneum TaxID=7070 RepID=D2A318_TRICA|nr:PREDICTED: kinesin-like protein costa isoform X2 [Tribolium castaneum]EFA01968.1 Kinesin-like protein costa [Tribolium castaneum]|eukprot:XP_973391.1 PREDICTED: kinesin-like protein costa isoform X2 [Tribolium castaneum]